jgi:hypothetical protein
MNDIDASPMAQYQTVRRRSQTVFPKTLLKSQVERGARFRALFALAAVRGTMVLSVAMFRLAKRTVAARMLPPQAMTSHI